MRLRTWAQAFLMSTVLSAVPSKAASPAFDHLFDSINPPFSASEFSNGSYIVPNEEEYYLFDSALKGRTGVLISVGTFRALEDASRGEFSHLLMLDLDAGTVEFNRWQVEVLKISENRADFFSNLRTLPYKGLPNVAAHRKEYVEKIFQFSDPHLAHKANFLNSESRYRKLRAMALAGNISVIQANVVGSEMIEISRMLEARSLSVSVLDLSNAPDYFLSRSDYAFEEFKRTLKALPFTADAQLIFTTTHIPQLDKKSLFGWTYLKFSVAEYLTEMESFKEWNMYSYRLNGPSFKAHILNPEPLPPSGCAGSLLH